LWAHNQSRAPAKSKKAEIESDGEGQGDGSEDDIKMDSAGSEDEKVTKPKRAAKPRTKPSAVVKPEVDRAKGRSKPSGQKAYRACAVPCLMFVVRGLHI